MTAFSDREYSTVGAMRPMPRALAWIPLPGPTGPAKLLMFLLCSSRQHHNLWYVAEKRAVLEAWAERLRTITRAASEPTMVPG